MKFEKIPEYLKKTPQQLLWQKVSEIEKNKKELKKKQDVIFQEVSELRKKKIITALEKDNLFRLESEYWNINEQIGELDELDDGIQELLLALDEGKIGEKEVRDFLKISDSETKPSKQKIAITRLREKMGEDPRNHGRELGHSYGGYGYEANRVSSGRNLSSIKNAGDSSNPLGVAAAFYEATSGTHGGKVSTGKTGRSYISVGGKKVRKK